MHLFKRVDEAQRLLASSETIRILSGEAKRLLTRFQRQTCRMGRQEDIAHLQEGAFERQGLGLGDVQARAGKGALL